MIPFQFHFHQTTNDIHMKCMPPFQHKLNFTLGWTIVPDSIFAKISFPNFIRIEK